jgi:acyl-CoA dehydrogenase
LAPLLAAFREALPDMSPTERDAIDAGTVWWEAEVFTGRPRWDALLAHGPPKLSDEERRFINEDCERFAELVNDWEITTVWHNLPEAAWQSSSSMAFSA